MKRTIKALFVAAVIMATVAVTGIVAGASSYDAQADSLKNLGLFYGTEDGYELDKTSTRAESAVMLVRLLGVEDEVKAGNYSDPFTDVPEWADKYIGYMYENGLTKGISDTAFGSNENCSLQMFTSFVLRALGYSEESGDFTYAQAQDFAAEIGLTDNSGASDTFLRDDMVALAYSALFQNVNDGSGKTLLEKLVSENAVDASAANACLSMYDTYKEYASICSQTQQYTNMQLKSVSDVAIKMQDVDMDMSQTTDSYIVFKKDNLTFMQENTVTYEGTTEHSTSYYSDGWLYMDLGTEKYKYQYPMDFEAILSKVGADAGLEPFYFIDSIEKVKDETGTTYKITYSAAAMNGLIGSTLSELTDTSAAANFQFNYLKAVIKFDAKGNNESTLIDADISYEMVQDGQTIPVQMTIQSTTTTVSVGDSVTFDLPSDLDKYQELDYSQGT
jgi:hypothetical protein